MKPVIFAVLLGLTGLALFALLPEQTKLVLSSEEGWVEMSSAIVLFGVGVLLLFLKPILAWAHLSMLAFVLAEREAEAEALAPGLVRDALSWLDQVFLKNIVVEVILLLWLAFGLIRYTLPGLRKHFRNQSDILGIIALAGFCAVFAQVLDKGLIADEATPFGGTTLHVWEELLEFYFAVFLFAAAALGLARQKAQR